MVAVGSGGSMGAGTGAGFTSTGLKKSGQMVTKTLPGSRPWAGTPTSSTSLGPSHRMGRPTHSNASSTNCLHACSAY